MVDCDRAGSLCYQQAFFEAKTLGRAVAHLFTWLDRNRRDDFCPAHRFCDVVYGLNAASARKSQSRLQVRRAAVDTPIAFIKQARSRLDQIDTK